MLFQRAFVENAPFPEDAGFNQPMHRYLLLYPLLHLLDLAPIGLSQILSLYIFSGFLCHLVRTYNVASLC